MAEPVPDRVGCAQDDGDRQRSDGGVQKVGEHGGILVVATAINAVLRARGHLVAARDDDQQDKDSIAITPNNVAIGHSLPKSMFQ